MTDTTTSESEMHRTEVAEYFRSLANEFDDEDTEDSTAGIQIGNRPRR